MLESLLVRLSIACPTCRISLPVNGIVERIRCYHCGESTSLSSEFWTQTLPREYFAEAQHLGSTQTVEISEIDEGLRLAYGYRPPQCQSCQGPSIDLALLTRAAREGSCHCTACGKSIRVRTANELCRAVHPQAHFVVHETASGEAGEAVQAQTKPVLFACMNCGGGLRVDGSSRAVACQYCQSSNYLPDGLWNTLNPVPKPTAFFLVCDIPSAEERTRSAARLDLSADTLAALATDSSVEVRAALAANPKLAAATMAQLAFDRDRRVLLALAGNPNLTPNLVQQMAESDDTEFKLLALHHPHLVQETLEQLSEDPDPAVQQAARARLGLPPKEPSLFKRWFGSS